jgi:apolipoprotein N-acyltransferase
MNAKTQKPNPRSEKNQSASFLIWFISGLYLLGMVWFLLSTVGMWLMSAVVACTVSYAILMMLFWPFENVSPEGRPERLVR